ncbi:hypothetical protein [Microbulbifer spongiae]|uniref:Uncharacterized protein n=1 Tax=Microbulbifer spongiae TaxID=2944933 RepID=A0ABY9E906_9GAMM|nr:hypothetical protein [Microbulbifer sp. MI-G]WKD48925.1 hypothetical protein M8T91_13615 [Microbulbifer sp. MI-G]
MKVIIHSTLFLFFLVIGCQVSAQKANFKQQCEAAGHLYVENFDVTDVYPSLMGTGIGSSPVNGDLSSYAVYFGNESGSLYAVDGIDSQLAVDNLLNTFSRSTTNIYGLVYAALAVNQLIDICANTTTSPRSVVAIRYSLENLHRQDSDIE